MENKKLRVAMFVDTFYPMIDGVIMVVDNYAKRLSKIADVTVFCPYARTKTDEEYDKAFNYKIVRCKSIKVPHTDYCLAVPNLDKKFKKYLKNSKFDIVHIHSPFSIGKMGIKYAKKHSIPVIATLHSQYKKDFLRETHSKTLANLMLKKIIKVFNQCDECWTVNQEIERVYKEEYKLTTNCKIQRNATDIKICETSIDDIERIDKKYGIQKGDKVFLFVGRLTNLKNILFIVDALKKVKESNIKFKMLYVGTGPDEDKLIDKIKENNLQEDIILCGRIEDREEMRQLYERADLFLFPSMYDTNSLVQIEAASQKTPTVFIRGSATSSTVTEDVNGFMSKEDYVDYAKKIIECMTNDEYYNKVKEGAFRDLYVSWDNVIVDVYQDYLVHTKNDKME